MDGNTAFAIDLIQTTVTALDYGRTEEARQTINRWAEEQTRKKIKELFPSGVVSGQTLLVLANAIYFKGKWENPFDGTLTRDGVFRLAAGRTVTTPMMKHGRLDCGYFADADVQLLDIPCVGRQLSLLVILPQRVDGLGRLERSLTPAKLKEWTAQLHGGYADVSLPKSKIASYVGGCVLFLGRVQNPAR